MDGTKIFWLILGMAVVTYIPRALPIFLSGKMKFSGKFEVAVSTAERFFDNLIGNSQFVKFFSSQLQCVCGLRCKFTILPENRGTSFWRNN